MTLLEACVQIVTVARCSEADALVQLRGALADGVLICKWDPPGVFAVPRGGWWLGVKIRIPGDGYVLDDRRTSEEWRFGVPARYGYRMLLILRESLSALWPLPPSLRDASYKEIEAAYKQHLAEDGYQNEKQDLAWGEQRGVKQEVVRALRKKYPRKAGRPKRG
jgi:hypothetical protein